MSPFEHTLLALVRCCRKARTAALHSHAVTVSGIQETASLADTNVTPVANLARSLDVALLARRDTEGTNIPIGTCK